MQLAMVVVRLGGLLTNTVPKTNVTPAEVLVLRAIHGQDAVVDIRPTGEDERRRGDAEFARLAGIYEPQAGGFNDQPDPEREGVISKLFPGAVKRLPATFEEIGIEGLEATEPAPEPVPNLPDATEDEVADEDAGGENAADVAGEDATGGAGGEQPTVAN